MQRELPVAGISTNFRIRPVVVPANLFKLVYDQDRGEAWAYWVENTNTAKMSAPVTYSQIKKLTGIDFNLPAR